MLSPKEFSIFSSAYLSLASLTCLLFLFHSTQNRCCLKRLSVSRPNIELDFTGAMTRTEKMMLMIWWEQDKHVALWWCGQAPEARGGRMAQWLGGYLEGGQQHSYVLVELLLCELSVCVFKSSLYFMFPTHAELVRRGPVEEITVRLSK